MFDLKFSCVGPNNEAAQTNAQRSSTNEELRNNLSQATSLTATADGSVREKAELIRVSML
jgi:hypothetical protein